ARRPVRMALAAGLLGVFASSSARADLTPVLGGIVSNSPTAGQNTFQYSVGFATTAGDQILEGSGANQGFVTLYDIAGFVSAAAPANWIVSQSLVGKTAPQTAPLDDPSIINVTFTYVGSTVTAATTFTGFQIVSTLPGQVLGAYTGQTTQVATGRPIGSV